VFLIVDAAARDAATDTALIDAGAVLRSNASIERRRVCRQLRIPMNGSAHKPLIRKGGT
jgi:hypothetical protein